MLIINEKRGLCNSGSSSSMLFGAPKMALWPIPKAKNGVLATFLFLETFETFSLEKRRIVKRINLLVVVVACFKLVSGCYAVTICYRLLQVETLV